MNEIRRRIKERLEDLNKSQSWLSQKLGRNRAYVYQYLEEGSPRELAYEDRLRVAELLDMPLTYLGIATVTQGTKANAPAGLREDAVPFDPPRAHFLSRSPNLAYFRMKSRALDQHPERILPGQILAFDLNRTKIAEIAVGKIVIAELYDKRDLTKSHGTIVREFIPPNKLISNSSEANEIISLDDETLAFEAAIKGTLISVVQEFN